VPDLNSTDTALAHRPEADHVTPLATASASVNAAFTRGLDEVQTIREMTGDLLNRLGQLLEVEFEDHQESPGPHEDFVGSVSEASRAIGGIVEALGSAKLFAIQRQMHVHLQGVRGSALQLSTSSVLASIICAENRIEETQFKALIDELRDRSEELRVLSSSSITTLGKTVKATMVARDALSAVAEAFAHTAGDMRSKLDALAPLEAAHRAHVAARRDDGERLRDAVQREIGRLVGCLQFPDTFAQRTEHVSAMLIGLGDCAALEAARRRRLAAAQLEDMATAHEKVVETARSALTSIRSALATQLRGRAASDPSMRWIDAQHATDAGMAAAIEMAGHRLRSVERSTVEMRATIEAVDEGLSTARALNRRLKATANNAGIAAGRAEGAAAPLGMLARTVHTATFDIARVVDGLCEGLSAFGEISDRLAGADLAGRIEALDVLSLRAAERGRANAIRVEGFEAINDRITTRAEQIEHAVGAALAALDRTDRQMPVLRRLAASLVADPSTRSAAIEGPAPELAPIWDLYTMEAERNVHAALFGRAAEAEAGDDVELDDFVL
jgi:hypothetical protein